MATVRFTQNIQRHVACPTRDAKGSTLREVLDYYFSDNPRARGYVLDEQGKIRQHMVAFIDGELVRDRDTLSDPVGPNAVVDVIQALSGGWE
jgi:molybdopterin synthase sulfur carrier subunit